MSKLPLVRSILLGLTAGSRAMTPLAAVANAARTNRLPEGAPEFLSHPLVSAGATALAVYELVGDKQATAPDRIVTPAVVVRTLNAAFAGAMVAPRGRRVAGAVVAGGTAVVATYVTWRIRRRSMRHHGAVSTGFAEDAIVVPVAIAAAAG